jgi:hypothetical protein
MGRKTQHILVFIQDQNYMRKAIVHAFKLASIFKTEVAFAQISKNASNNKLPISLIDELNTENIAYKEISLGNLEIEPNNTIQQLEAIFIVTEFAKGNFLRLNRMRFSLIYTRPKSQAFC